MSQFSNSVAYPQAAIFLPPDHLEAQDVALYEWSPDSKLGKLSADRREVERLAFSLPPDVPERHKLLTCRRVVELDEDLERVIGGKRCRSRHFCPSCVNTEAGIFSRKFDEYLTTAPVDRLFMVTVVPGNMGFKSLASVFAEVKRSRPLWRAAVAGHYHGFHVCQFMTWHLHVVVELAQGVCVQSWASAIKLQFAERIKLGGGSLPYNWFHVAACRDAKAAMSYTRGLPSPLLFGQTGWDSLALIRALRHKRLTGQSGTVQQAFQRVPKWSRPDGPGHWFKWDRDEGEYDFM